MTKRRGVNCFTYARFPIHTSCSCSQHIYGRIYTPLLLFNKNFDQKLPDALALVGNVLPGCKPEEKQESDDDAHELYFQEIMTKFTEF